MDDWRARFLASGDDADLPIVDAHQHYFDIEAHYYPWLNDRPLRPFRYGDYSSICRSFLPQDYRRLTGQHRIVQTVVIEGEWDPATPADEVGFIESLARQEPTLAAMVGQVWLDREDAPSLLREYSKHPLVRGVRHKPTVTTREDWREDFVAPGSMRDPRWREGYAQLAENGLHFELQAPWWHMPEAAELARDFPDVTIVVNHTALPADRSPEGLAGWRDNLALLAREPNVALKISGICIPGQAWPVEANRVVVNDAISIFDVSRCAFASNYPVDGVVNSLSEVLDGFKTIVRDRSRTDRLALFHDNARRIYRLT
ncbi:amidohydrolase family protein [Pseudomonas frederiksbergensis]|uniref:amidohydrolase family protein n=1 Tax=Pseudomonas frederiksbergensis TaxID=104087 RepID=UPI000F479469|nr:amidohydrolase family protein [Pseudomonas frederiksbergensis]RON43738.1 thioesterase [Pseudomonas frederiksbergensis]